MTQVSDSVIIAVDPMTVYDVVSRPDRIPEFSPENTRGIVESPGEPPSVGMRFVGRNRRRGMRWCTGCEVTVAEPGKQFAFKVRKFGYGKPRLHIALATWDYTLESCDDGTRVTETWTDDRRNRSETLTKIFDRIVTGKPGFAEYQRGNIAESLARLKRLLEG